MPYYNRDQKRDHNFDNHPYDREGICAERHTDFLLRRVLRCLGGGGSSLVGLLYEPGAPETG